MLIEYAGGSRVNIHRRVVNHFRRQWFAAIDDIYQSPSVFYVPGLVMYKSGSNQREVNVSKLSSALGSPHSLFFITGMFCLMLNSSDVELVGLVGIVTFLIGTVASIWGLILGILDYRCLRQIRSLKTSPTPEGAADTLQYVDSYQPEIRCGALELINHVSEGTPGKVLKQSNRDASSIAETLIQSLHNENKLERQLAASTIKWYSRDYSPAFQPFSKQLASFVDYSDSIVQTGVVIALGNIGRTAGDSQTAYVKAISPAAKDEDPDVRQASALALGNLDCEASSQVLQHLAEDTAPDVRQQAVQSLQSLDQVATSE
ncbi:HEAT repeat domain-containing protein [Halorubrum coriense]|uniref:HEAT repeat domain-containing protein n=1 Tax=Halorubrum coriense TaxID=64713 RepID=UPI0009B5AE26|nr:HEAT repeat domain-containing protein [Halorubrum coriense]QRG24174.1 HEAT-domain protein [Halorubrum virus Humcor1]